MPSALCCSTWGSECCRSPRRCIFIPVPYESHGTLEVSQVLHYSQYTQPSEYSKAYTISSLDTFMFITRLSCRISQLRERWLQAMDHNSLNSSKVSPGECLKLKQKFSFSFINLPFVVIIGFCWTPVTESYGVVCVRFITVPGSNMSPETGILTDGFCGCA
jgi:hypothetical protein